MAFVKHKLPCNKCGGSDPVSLDDKGAGFCFSCNTYFKNYSTSEVPQNTDTITDFKTYQRNSSMETQGFEAFHPLTDRKISLETAKKYGVKSTLNPDGSVDKHYYPFFVGTELVATKIRKANKGFAWTGNSKEAGLFGEHLFKGGGKFITLVEGECDAMAAYELMGSKWPVVSVKLGAAGGLKDVKQSLEFLESFESVVINFDNDKHGNDAAREIAKILMPGKAKLMQLPEGTKDANELLRQGRHATYVSCFWDAKPYTPSGVLNVSEQREAYQKSDRKRSIPYPWSGLNKKLEGLRSGELVTLTGGTGLGKSSVTRELEHWLINNTKDNVGIIALEEDWRRTIDGILSIEANAKLHIDRIKSGFVPEQLDKYYDNVFAGDNEGRVWIHAHHGMNDLDSVFSKLRYMIIGCDCKWIIVDHLHMLVLSTLESDERKAIDSIMHRLRTLVEETGCGMVLVSHLRRVEGNRGHENGIETGLNHLRGSQSIAQLSDCVIALERNQQAEDVIEASTTKVRVLKSRYTGDVGVATSLLYDNNTGRLKEIVGSYDIDHFQGDEL